MRCLSATALVALLASTADASLLGLPASTNLGHELLAWARSPADPNAPAMIGGASASIGGTALTAVLFPENPELHAMGALQAATLTAMGIALFGPAAQQRVPRSDLEEQYAEATPLSPDWRLLEADMACLVGEEVCGELSFDSTPDGMQCVAVYKDGQLRWVCS